MKRLSDWLEVAGPADDQALLFRTRNDKRPTLSNWGRSLKRASALVDSPPLSPYDCRHACATTWLQAGVPLGEAALRLGHSVETLVAYYIGALQGDDAIANQRISAVLNEETAESAGDRAVRPAPVPRTAAKRGFRGGNGGQTPPGR